MPSSHGGGFSGGGGGGGGFSSHSGGSSGGSSGPRYSRTRPFPGATRFVYIGPLGAQRYFYYAGVPYRTKNPAKRLIVFSIIAVVILIFAAIISNSLVPKKLTEDDCDATGVYINDATGIIADTTELNAAMAAFYDKTGVEPYLYVTTYAMIPETYKYSGKVQQETLENYAYRLYTQTFADEGHWLILFAVNETPSSNYDKWGWIDMAGDDTGNIVTDTVFEEFQTALQRTLNAYPDNYAGAITAAFNKATENAVEWNMDTIMPIAMVWLFSLIFGFVLVGSAVSNYKQCKDMNEYLDYQERTKGQPNPDANVFSDNTTASSNGYYNNQTSSGAYDDFDKYSNNSNYDPNDDDGIRF